MPRRVMDNLEEEVAEILEGRVVDKFLERNAVHQNLWANDSLDELAHHVRHKSKRVLQVIDKADGNPDIPWGQLEDDLIDLIVYAAFMIHAVDTEAP